jgi:hypothetical protein
MYEEQPCPPHLNFNLSSYQLDEAGLVANIEQAREIIRNLQSIIRFLQASPFDRLPISMQAEISLYLVGTHLLTHSSGYPYDDTKAVALEAIFNGELDALIRGGTGVLDADEILQGVEEMFGNFGAE